MARASTLVSIMVGPLAPLNISRPEAFIASTSEDARAREDFLISKSRRFQLQSSSFLQSKNQVHVLHSLAGGPFQQVVDQTGDDQHLSVLLQVQYTFVGVHHLFQVWILVCNKRKRMRSV